MTWRLTNLAVIIVLVIGCNDSKKNTKTGTDKLLEEKPAVKKEISLQKQREEFLYLTNKNAVSVFQKYIQNNKERRFKISTIFGDIVIKIYGDTPIHSGNFLYLVKEKKYYDSTLFYRVSPDFIIQGGDADNDNIQSRRFAIGDYHLPAEFSNKRRHFRGAVGMSRTYGNNPEKVSTAFDFYIVLGKKMAPVQLQAIERDNGIKYSKEDVIRYQTAGGTPHLDFQHTVFGEVVSGLEVAEKISQIKADSREWPYDDVAMAISIIQ
jgi:cyclophilin family peptidyl-prolyl cis-trans isomerase